MRVVAFVALGVDGVTEGSVQGVEKGWKKGGKGEDR